jgi:hypothetical protein
MIKNEEMQFINLTGERLTEKNKNDATTFAMARVFSAQHLLNDFKSSLAY